MVSKLIEETEFVVMPPSPNSRAMPSTESSRKGKRGRDGIFCGNADGDKSKKTTWSLLTRIFALAALVASLRFFQLQGQLTQQLRRGDAKHLAKMMDDSARREESESNKKKSKNQKVSRSENASKKVESQPSKEKEIKTKVEKKRPLVDKKAEVIKKKLLTATSTTAGATNKSSVMRDSLKATSYSATSKTQKAASGEETTKKKNRSGLRPKKHLNSSVSLGLVSYNETISPQSATNNVPVKPAIRVQDITNNSISIRPMIASSKLLSSNESVFNASNIINKASRKLSHYLSSGDRLLEDIIPGYKEHDPTEWQYPPPPCGNFKCFFPSQHYPEVGYTVGQLARRIISYTPAVLFETYELVQRLSKQIAEHPYNLPPMMHLYHPEYPPVIVPYNNSKYLYYFMKQEYELAESINNGTATIRATQEQAAEMERYTMGENSTLRPRPKEQWSVRHHSNGIEDYNNDKGGDDKVVDETNITTSEMSSNARDIKIPFSFRSKKFFKKDFYIQVLWKIPYNSFLYYYQQQDRYKQKNINVTMEWLESLDVLLERQHQSNNQSLTQRGMALADIAYWYDFDETLYHYINQTIVLLQIDPTLSTDFQVAIDPQGRIWHFDMDRGLGHDLFNKTDQEYRRKKMKVYALDRIPRDLKQWYAVVHKYVKEKVESLMPEQEKKKLLSEEQYKEWKARMRRSRPQGQNK
ncbi:hypothetical protein IV203_013070 [Nitzschia inconspicua]|uniref:Uncharacterized protein n=1 Tax=Nitzschia inconspicua TaxID=303405 RepID=A0A9K3Q8I4_9STRA|nr:hypothetical protein IV203_013070 [Nitzschia inconspicua]